MTRSSTAFSENAFLAYFARHRVAPNLLMVLVILAGVVGLNQLSTQLFPDVSPGVATVTVGWSGNGAQVVLDRVTEPLERDILELDLVNRVRSTTQEGGAQITVTFNVDADTDAAMTDLRSAVDSVALPSGADRPQVTALTFAEPVIFAMFSYDGQVSDLRPLLHDFERELNARGIPDIDIQGLDSPEILISVSPTTLQEEQWSLSGLGERIMGVADRFSAGQAGVDDQVRSVVTGEQLTRAEQWRRIPLDGTRRLGDLATVDDGSADPTRVLSYEGENAVLMQLSRSRGMASGEVSEIYRAWHDETVPNLPSSLSVDIFADNSEFVHDNVDLLVTNGFYGLLLVLATLFIFLNLRVAFWTAMGIPVALFGTLALLNMTGGTLNFFSMFAMLMALGIIVDNAIVVGEETQSMVERGVASDSAASAAVSRMYAPIIASSLTTIAAFSPLLFVPGIFGELLRPIPIVIIAVIAAALVECFLILPGHLHLSFGRSSGRGPNRLRAALNGGIEHVREQWYRPLVTSALRQRSVSVALATGLMIISLGMVVGGIVPFSVDLEVEAEEVFADVTFVDGASREDMLTFVSRMEAGLNAAAAHFSEDGEADTLLRNAYFDYDLDAGTAFFVARLPSPDDRPFSNQQFLREWEANVELSAVVDRLRIDSESGGGQSASDLNLRLSGDDPEALRAGVQALMVQLTERGDLRNIEDSLPGMQRQLQLDLTVRARELGLTEQQVANQLASALNGMTVQSFSQFGDDVDVRLQLTREAREQLDLVSWLPIELGDGSRLPLSDLADFTEREEPIGITREGGRESVTVTASPASEDINTSAVQAELQATVMPPLLAQYGLSADYQTGQDAAELLDNLVIAAWAALALMFIILAWMFQSYSWPLAVMTSIPFAMTGAIFGHWALGLELNFLSIFGLFGLAGIVINGSIILIARYRELLLDGMDQRSAIIEASCQRFRPVILTTLTTVMGLIPILLETSVQAQLIRSMAVSLAFGLGYGALLVLIVIPCVLSYVQSMGAGTARFLRWVLPQRGVRVQSGDRS